MKKIIILLILVSHSALYAQTEWATIGTEWYYCLPNEANNPMYSYEKFTSVKDTIVSGKTCKLIKSKQATEIMYAENGKVYFWYMNNFRLLYNFEAKPGDAITFSFKSYKPNSLVKDTFYNVQCNVAKIDTIIVNNTKLKRYKTTVVRDITKDFLVWPAYYIYTEKIGFEEKFMFTLDIPSIMPIYKLRCYKDNLINYQTDWWKYFNVDCDYSLLTDVKKNPIDINYELYSNIVDNQLIIESNQLIKKCTIKIFTVAGKVLLNDSFNEKLIIIDSAPFPRGILILTIYENNALIFVNKIMKQ